MAEFPSTNLVKICGVTTPADARVVVNTGADIMGLILAKSTRRLTPKAARRVADAVRGSILTALVVRDQDDGFIWSSVQMVQPDVVQIHGMLSGALETRLRGDGRLIIKALAIDTEEFENFDETRVDAVLVDGPTPGVGEVHSWSALERRHFVRPVIAAGGLTPDNVASTIALVCPRGVDCASGVESSPGRKDPTLVRRFVDNARRGFDQ